MQTKSSALGETKRTTQHRVGLHCLCSCFRSIPILRLTYCMSVAMLFFFIAMEMSIYNNKIGVSHQQIGKDLEDYIGDFIDILPCRYAQRQRHVWCACISLDEFLFVLHWNRMAIFGHWQQWMDEWAFAWLKTKSIQWKIVPENKSQPVRLFCTHTQHTQPNNLALILVSFPWTHCRHLIVENTFSNNRC